MKKALLVILLTATMHTTCFSGEDETPVAQHQVRVGGNETLLTDDGNFLFYNNPVSASYLDRQYFTWITSNGNVILRTLQRDGRSTDTIIHSFAEDINPDLGNADDHAAPAILLDKQREVLIIAVSYHGTPMYIYVHDVSNGANETRLLKNISGRYTYPRLFEHEGVIHLLARAEPEGIRAGHLIMRRADDGFDSEHIVIGSEDGEVIYAGTPTLTNQGFAIAYSKHSYKENRLIGFDLLEYNIKQKAPSRQCDLSAHIEPEAYSNRPTGIGYNGNNLIVTTTYTNQENGERSEKYENFLRRNKVIILRGKLNDCESFSVIEKREVGLPYYHTSVAVNDSLEWLYFDGNQYHTNIKIPQCFTSEKMMYPNFTKNGVIYAAMNRRYSIRDFSNSILFCSRKF